MKSHALPALAIFMVAACGGAKKTADVVVTPASKPPAALAGAAARTAGTGAAPDTSDMGAFVLAKINASPNVDGKATLVEFRQKSISKQALGDKMQSAVVEFEGVVTFSNDVAWSWQGPTKAGEPQKFEARAEYVDEGNGWKLVEPLGIYPL